MKKYIFAGLLVLSITAITASVCLAAEETVQGYSVKSLPSYFAVTAANGAGKNITVSGKPRMAKGHPCTLWDQEDLTNFRAQLKTSKGLKEEFDKLKIEMDKQLSKPIPVPGPGKEPPTKEIYRIHKNNADIISDMGTIYALTEDPKYGEYGKKILLAYASNYPKYPHIAGWTEAKYRSAKDGRLTGQFLEDGGWLIRAARGYDLLYNLPSWTEKERKLVKQDLFEAIAYEFTAEVLGPKDYLSATHNRSVICTCGVLMAGYATDNEKLINQGLYGKNGTKEKPVGGVFGTHFGPNCIDVDGMWNEGAMGYQFMALGALINDAEMLWRHNVDMYSYRNSALKGLFDSALQFLYPDYTFPSTHDSSRMSIFTSWFTDCQHAFEYGYLQYKDPRYLSIINKVPPHLALSTHEGPTSVIFDRDSAETTQGLANESVNFNGVGYGILRLNSPNGIAGLLLEYGPSRSHGHPSKLCVDLYALNDVILPDPGSIFPYGDPLNEKWYHATPGHCAMIVDEKNQIFWGNRWKFKDSSEPEAAQLVFGPASTMGIQRAFSATVIPGVTQDRALFMTPQYIADLFGAFSKKTHKYDLAWHIRGELSSGLPLKPLKFPDPVEDGYNALENVRNMLTDKPWDVSVTRAGNAVRFFAAGGINTDVVFGEGYYRTAKRENEKVPAVLERRAAKASLFGNALDISGGKSGYIKKISQAGGLEAGYGLLKVETIKGVDLCFSAYRPGLHKADGLETDALQAFVLMNGSRIAAMYLGGGKSIKAGNAELRRNEPGLAYFEETNNGSYIVANPSNSDTVITVVLPPLAGLKAFNIEGKGRRTGPAEITTGTVNAFVLKMQANTRVEFSDSR